MTHLRIAILLVVQACLLFTALDLLPIWSDEANTMKTVAHPVREIIPLMQRDVHPPLYFILLRQWTRLPLPGTRIAVLRAFSVLWTLLATLLMDLFWTRSWSVSEARARWLALGLFVLSPCLLLYSRMARSYSMQVALAVLSLGLLQRWMSSPGSWTLASGAYAAVLALLYTHYVPGVAIMAGFVLVGWRALGWTRTAAFAVAVAAGYFPWLLSLVDALRRWGQAGSFSSSYAATGNPLREQLLKMAYGLISLTAGETFLIGSLLLVPVILLLALLGLRGREFPRSFAVLLAIAACIGYLGVSRWVSYPFIPARLLWLLPFLILAVALGIAQLSRPVLRNGVILVVLLSYISSDILYFRREDFLNLGYNAPLREIAATLNEKAQADDLVLLDSYNTDQEALQVYLSAPARVIVLDPNTGTAAKDAAPAAHTVWIVRNTRDVSPGHSTSEAESQSCAGRSRTDTLLEPYPQWEKTAMKLAGIQPAPTHFYQLTRCTSEK